MSVHPCLRRLPAKVTRTLDPARYRSCGPKSEIGACGSVVWICSFRLAKVGLGSVFGRVHLPTTKPHLELTRRAKHGFQVLRLLGAKSLPRSRSACNLQ